MANVFVLFIFFVPLDIFGACIALVEGPVAFDVNRCEVVNPQARIPSSEAKNKFVYDLPRDERAKFFRSYQGLELSGRVMRSLAINKGFSEEKGALSGENLTIFANQGQCNAFLGKRLAGVIKQSCCDGGGRSPCLLGTSYSLTNIKVVGIAGSPVTETKSKRISRDEAKARKAFNKKRFKAAAALFEKASKKSPLSMRGQFEHALSYRLMDQCANALPILDRIYQKSLKRDTWADDERWVRASVFLLARCHAILNEPEYVEVILNSYLAEPQKYKDEISRALRHKDFGWIHTSKAYQKFKAKADQLNLR